MGRGRGKGKKLTVSNEEDSVNGEDEKVPVQKRRGRPQKILKDDYDEEVIEELIEEDDSGDTFKSVVSSKEMKNPNTTKHGRKRKRNIQEKIESVEEKNVVVIVKGSKSNSDESTKCNGFRHNGSRRKSKPRRAAEAGVMCKQDFA